MAHLYEVQTSDDLPYRGIKQSGAQIAAGIVVARLTHEGRR